MQINEPQTAGSTFTNTRKYEDVVTRPHVTQFLVLLTLGTLSNDDGDAKDDA